MAKKPSYIGLLNAIANGERGGHELFKNWSAVTPNKALKPTLDMIAIREMEHSWAFEKRLNELGFDLRPAKNKETMKQAKFLKSSASDEAKFASFGIGTKAKKNSKAKPDDEPDRLLQILADKTIDPQTGALMGRFISEERDTGRALLKAYRKIHARQGKK